jgi:hypothetical protein
MNGWQLIEAVFCGTVDRILQLGHNLAPVSGGPEDPSAPKWVWQLEDNYVAGEGEQRVAFDEAFLQLDCAEGAGSCRPFMIKVDRDNPRRICNVNVSVAGNGTFTVTALGSVEADGAVLFQVCPDGRVVVPGKAMIAEAHIHDAYATNLSIEATVRARSFVAAGHPGIDANFTVRGAHPSERIELTYKAGLLVKVARTG